MQCKRISRVATTSFFALAACACFTTSAVASPLTGSGNHLPIPSPNPGRPNYQTATLATVSGGFTGTWTAPADSDWWGTFNATGPIPTDGNSGNTDYDFTNLALGYLPTGTFFDFGDVDYGSVNSETFTLVAYANGSDPITTAWLNEPVGVWGTGSGSGGTPAATDMPGWSFDTTTGTYTVEGNTVTGANPTLNLALTSNVPIYSLNIVKNSTFNAFWLAAPTVPEPTSLALLAVGGLMLLPRRKRHQIDASM